MRKRGDEEFDKTTFLKNAYSTLLNQCHVLRQIWRRKGVRHSI